MTEQQVNNIINPGALPHVPKITDLDWGVVGSGVAPFDWNKGYDIRKVLRDTLNNYNFNLPVKDQNGSGSCGGQATASYNAVKEAIATKTYEEESAKFVIAQTFKVDESGHMLGSLGRDNVSLAVKMGVARENTCPSYDHGNPPGDSFMNRPQDITELARADAKSTKEKSYAFVEADIDSYAQAIASNHGILATIGGENNGTWFSAYPKPPTKRQWGHFLYTGAAIAITPTEYQGWKDGVINYNDLAEKYGF